MGGCIGSKKGLEQKKSENGPTKKDEKKKPNSYGEHSDDSDDEEQNDAVDLMDRESIIKMKANRGPHKSVSAEVFGQFNKKGDYKAREIPKTSEQRERITNKMLQSFMFQALDDRERNIVILAFEEKKFDVGETVIQQGEDGDVLYLVDSGELDCYKVFKPGQDPTFLKTYHPGESFGELALLYNAPRAATIKAKTQAILFSLDRECFNHIVKESAAKKRQAYENLLGKIEILGEVDPYEKLQIADALQPLKFKQGDIVIKEGEQGDKFFFVEIGEAEAFKDKQVVMHYKEGDYFGELALLKDQPRAATVIAKTDLQLAVLDRASFKRLLGPIEDLMKRNVEKYKNYIQ